MQRSFQRAAWLALTLTLPIISYAAQAQSNILSRPSASSSNDAAWSTFLRVAAQEYIAGSGLHISHGYFYYFVPGADPVAVDARRRQEENIRDTASRLLRPGNFLAFGGPDERATARSLSVALKNGPPGWAQGSTLLVFCAPADENEVTHVLQGSGAAVHFMNIRKKASVTMDAEATPVIEIASPPPPPPAPPPPPIPPNHRPRHS